MWTTVAPAAPGNRATHVEQYIDPSKPTVLYRSLWPQDFTALKEAHEELFPIDYDDTFFLNAVTGQDRIFSFAATVDDGQTSQLAGFVTARVITMRECDEQSRRRMRLETRLIDNEVAVYILTLGVLPAWRQRGIATQLLSLVKQHAYSIKACKLLFLHVIAYNAPAIALYSRSFSCVAVLPSFYYISTGRQPYPEQTNYDAYLYALQLAPWTPAPSYLSQLSAAVNPLCCGMLPLMPAPALPARTNPQPSAPPLPPSPDSEAPISSAPLPHDRPSRMDEVPMWEQQPCPPPDTSQGSSETVLQWLFKPSVRWQ